MDNIIIVVILTALTILAIWGGRRFVERALYWLGKLLTGH